MKTLLIFILALAVYGNSLNSNSVICPFPNPDSDPATTCELYPACSYLVSSGLCHMNHNEYAGYKVDSAPEDTGRGFKVYLTKIDKSATLFQADILKLVFEVIYHESYHLQIKIYDPNNDRYEVPYHLNEPTVPDTDILYSVSISDVGNPFTFSVTRISTRIKMFEMLGPLSFEEQFIQISTPLASKYLYGFGENSHSELQHKFDGYVTPLFPRDQPVGEDHMNFYGFHPYYVNIEDDAGNTHSVLFYTSNAFEYRPFTINDDDPALTMRTIGGIIDLHFFLGPNPEEVNKQYMGAIGYPALPIYWSLGFHLSRYGYDTLPKFKKVVKRMQEREIPLDSLIIDIDYMDRYRAFTYDKEKWNGLPEYIREELHPENLHLSIITEPAVVIDFDNYPPGKRGLENNVYIKWSQRELVPEPKEKYLDDEMVGYVWPDTKVVFADYFLPAAVKWWTEESIILHKTLPFDGYWVDMNEPANFGTNLNRPWNYPEDEPDWSLKCPFTKYDDPPYPTRASTNHHNELKRLSDKTLCMEAVLSDGENSYLRYNVHSLHGHSMGKASYQALQQVFPGKRPFILSRSTFPGSGQYVSHWGGDNIANWEHLRLSIVNVLEFNLFGIPHIGVDICGFFLEPSEELCARWMQAGAFFPFSRNHNTINEPDQDPAREDWPNVQDKSRETLLIRYKYLPYLYTLMHKIHQSGGSAVRPMFSNWPENLQLRNINDQFMWGTDLLIAPIVCEKTSTRTVIFPLGKWYELIEGVAVEIDNGAAEANSPFESTPHTPPLFIRGGSILPYQEPAVNTILSRQNPFGLTIALDSDANAFGELFWDDGESLVENNSYFALISFVENELHYQVKRMDSSVNNLDFHHIDIYGYQNEPINIFVDDTPIPVDSWDYVKETSVLRIHVNIPMDINSFTVRIE